MNTKFKLLGICLLFSLGIFDTAAHVKLIAPLGGEVFEIGETMTIEWQVEVEHNQIDWDLYISYNGGTTWEVLAEGLDVELTSYELSTPLNPSKNVKIRIVQDNMDIDYDDISGVITFVDPDDPDMMGGMVTGIEDELFEPELFKVFPNPFIDQLTIDLPGQLQRQITSIEVFTLNGQIIASTSLRKSEWVFNSDRIVWNPGQKVSGMLLIKFSDGRRYQTLKVVGNP